MTKRIFLSPSAGVAPAGGAWAETKVTFGFGLEIVRPELAKYLKMNPDDAQKASLPNYFSEMTSPMIQFWIDAAHEFGVTKRLSPWIRFF
jgi:hypothetical protein